MTADAASARASGRAGPAVHTSRLPVPTALEKYTSLTGAEPSLPPAYRYVVPRTAPEPSTRAAGSWTCSGAVCHGRVVPPGAGQGRVSLSGGQKLTGDQASS